MSTTDRFAAFAFVIAMLAALIAIAVPDSNLPAGAVLIYEDGSGHTIDGDGFCLPRQLCD